jgi:hypothetical protein
MIKLTNRLDIYNITNGHSYAFFDLFIGDRVFSVKYELGLQILVKWSSDFQKGASSEGFQSRQTLQYGHESRGTRNREWLCWRRPAAIYLSASKGQSYFCYPVRHTFKHKNTERRGSRGGSTLLSSLTGHNTGYEVSNYLLPELHSLAENTISLSVNKMREQIQLLVGQTERHWYFTSLIHSMASCISKCVTLWLRTNCNIRMKEHNNPFTYHSQR